MIETMTDRGKTSSFNLHSESTGAKGNPSFLPLLMEILVKRGSVVTINISQMAAKYNHLLR
jgi:hypothetical protein